MPRAVLAAEGVPYATWDEANDALALFEGDDEEES
jgi:hypothetical protein